MPALKRIGIFGGSFNPVHRGHLTLAALARRQLALDTIFYVPAKCPPHKLGQVLAPPEDRVNMLKLCIGAAGRVSLFEVSRAQTTYTWQTLRYFRLRFPSAQLFFILGGDSISEIGAWKHSELIAKLCTIAAGARIGAKFIVPKILAASVVKLRGKIPDISSTRIRNLLAERKPVAGKVGNRVAEYIAKHKLYENTK